MSHIQGRAIQRWKLDPIASSIAPKPVVGGMTPFTSPTLRVGVYCIGPATGDGSQVLEEFGLNNNAVRLTPRSGRNPKQEVRII